ncbi:MAG: sigma-70 family RNA polymerase sigma factor [Saprospiraceae bacterium]|nr:sigma-70 family RNA polymerase sigma factor [Saprospiraceae bacterium]
MEERPSSSHDELLLEGLRSGDAAAVERIYRLYFSMVAHYVLSHQGTMEDARDIFQDVLVVLHRYSQNPQFGLTSKLSTLIYSISRNQWQNQRKIAGRQQAIQDMLLQTDDAQAGWEEETIFHNIQLGISELSPECRQMLDLFYFDQKSMGVIAEEMGYSADFVKVKKFRCLESLRKIVKAKLGWK